MPLSRRYYNLLGLFNNRYSYTGHAWTIKRKGPILLRMFRPSKLSHSGVKPLLDEANMPEEAKWFYVESVKVQTKDDGDNNQNYVKGQGHDDVTITPIPVFYEQVVRGVTTGKPLSKGLACTPSEETFDTNINGRTITRHKLEVKTQPSTDELWSRLRVEISGAGSLMEPILALLGFEPTYSQTILDRFSYNLGSYPDNMGARTGGRTMLPNNVVYRPPVEIEWSFIGRPLNTRNYLVERTGLLNYNCTTSIINRFDFTGIEDNRYPISSDQLTGIGIGTKRIDSVPIFNRYRYQLPSIILPTSSNEEEDYNVMNQNYSRAYRRSRLLSLLFDAAGLVNPLTFTATFVRMMINIPNLYMDYINEQARINDSKNNFEGFDMPFYYKILANVSFRALFNLDSGQTQTITMPTRKIEFMENGERTYETENRFIELPVNKLFKSIQEFEDFMVESGLPLRTPLNRYVYVKLEPYMELPEFEESYETWAKIGDPGLENW